MKTDGETSGQIDRQAGRGTGGWTDRQLHRTTKLTNAQMERPEVKHSKRQLLGLNNTGPLLVLNSTGPLPALNSTGL